jgi:hypothetical protein
MAPRLPALSRPYRPARAESARPDEPDAAVTRARIEDRRPFVLATGVALAAAIVLVLTWAASAPVLGALGAAVQWAVVHNDLTARAVLTVVLVALAAMAYVVAWSRATAPGRPVRVPGGRGTIAVHEVAAWLRDAVEARGDVRSAAVVVRSAGKGVRVSARVTVTADARLQDTGHGARTAIEQVLATHVGVPLAGAPIIELRYDELRLRPRPRGTRQECG